MGKSETLIPMDKIEQLILVINGQKVMLDSDLAHLYQVETRSLVQAVKRNVDRFPADFMVQLSKEEYDSLRSQNVISKGKGGRRYPPYVFTEQGVAMLSSVLKSKRAVQVNIRIMRAFVKLREISAAHAELANRLREIEQRLGEHDENIYTIFEVLRKLVDEKEQEEKPKKRIGFGVKEPKAKYGKRAKVN